MDITGAGVYQTQALMKLINSNMMDIVTELANAAHVINVLPNQNWLIQNNFISDHKRGDIGIYDLLLHKRDKAFSVKNHDSMD